jgi:hypothetical protein
MQAMFRQIETTAWIAAWTTSCLPTARWKTNSPIGISSSRVRAIAPASRGSRIWPATGSLLPAKVASGPRRRRRLARNEARRAFCYEWPRLSCHSHPPLGARHRHSTNTSTRWSDRPRLPRQERHRPAQSRPKWGATWADTRRAASIAAATGESAPPGPATHATIKFAALSSVVVMIMEEQYRTHPQPGHLLRYGATRLTRGLSLVFRTTLPVEGDAVRQFHQGRPSFTAPGLQPSCIYVRIPDRREIIHDGSHAGRGA